MVHAAETYALAVLENLIHWQTSTLPPTLVCVEIQIPDEIEQEQLDRTDMPSDPASEYSKYRVIGDDWYERGETAVLWVPSVASPFESNVLFNQQHRDFSQIRVSDPIPARVDPRLLRQPRS